MRTRTFLVAAAAGLALLAAPGASAEPTKQPVKKRWRPSAGEIGIGLVGWSKDEKRLAVVTEKLVDHPEGPPNVARDKKIKRWPTELEVGVYACPGFEMQDGHVILEAGRQGPKTRAAGWKRTIDYLKDDGFSAKALRREPPWLELESWPEDANHHLFDLPPELRAGEGAKLELSSLEGNPVITLLRPREGEAKPHRLKIEEYDASTFDPGQVECTLRVSPEARCLALLCAQGDASPYLGAYLLEAHRLRVPAK